VNNKHTYIPVSQMASLSFLPSIVTYLTLKSTPVVDSRRSESACIYIELNGMKGNEPMVGERSSKSSEVNLRRRLLLPTPESPIINNLNI